MKKGFCKKVWLLILDKLILGILAALIVWFMEDSRHQQMLDLRLATLAGQILPNIANERLDPETRARMLSVLADKEAIEPHAVAQFAQVLIQEKVSSRVLAQSISHSIRLDVAPFLQESAYLISKHYHRSSGKVSTRTVDAENCGEVYDRLYLECKRIELEDADRRSGLAQWRSAFSTYVDPEFRGPARDQLDSRSFLVGRVPLVEEQSSATDSDLENSRLHILAHILAPRSLERALDLTNSRVLGIERIGHLAIATFPEDASDEKSKEYVAEQLRRKPVDQEDAALLLAEVSVLASSEKLFGSYLQGEIAIPLAELFAKSESPRVRSVAGRALLSLADGGIAAESILVNHLHRLLRDLETSDDNPEGRPDHDADIETTVHLLSRLKTEPAVAAMKSVLAIPDSEEPFLAELKTFVKTSLGDQLARSEKITCDQWNTYEYFVTATPDEVAACLAAGANPNAMDEDGDTVLNLAIGANSSSTVVKMLLKAGAEPNATGVLRFTPLHVALGHNSHPGVVEVLIEEGANLKAQDVFDSTPVDNVAGNDNPEVINALAAKLENRRMLDRPLLALILSGRNLEVLCALYKANPQARYVLGYTPLHVAAAEADRPHVVEALLAAGAKPTDKDERGLTPEEVVNTAAPGATEIIRMLRQASRDEKE